ncbi:MAG: DNA polymerase III subunit delta' [Cyanobacteriota bacterium]|nr:DNA polymerase III subunit delta' [Cyanobacteriota bacterium]
MGLVSKSIQLPQQVLGQTFALQLLKSALQQDRIPPAYCFVGPAGVGKGLVAGWLAQALLCQGDPAAPLPCGDCSTCHLAIHHNHPDLLWLEPTYVHQGKLLTLSEAQQQDLQRRAPPQIRLEQIQTLIQFVSRAPLRASHSVVIVDGSETLAEAAANALLKTLEEPAHAILILLTSQVADLLPTILSRCQIIRFQHLSLQDLQRVLDSHHQSLPSPLLLSLAAGSPGQALAAIDIWQSIPDEIKGSLTHWPTSLRESMTLGRMIAKSLDVPSQLWLADYWQHYWWQQGSPERVRILEQIRQQLLSFVQPQLVWEVNLSPTG